MRSIMRVIAIATLSAIATVPGSGHATEARTVEATYAAPTPFILPGCDSGRVVDVPMDHLVGDRWTPGRLNGTGGACFAIAAEDRAASIEIRDISGLPVAGTAYFRRDDGSYIWQQTQFCSSASIAVPDGAATLYVSAESSAYACTLNDIVPAGPATMGRIRVTIDPAISE